MQLLTFAAAFLCLSCTALAQVTRTDTFLVMNDGVKLDAVYAYPATAPPSGGYPAILHVHGFGGSKDVNGAMAAANNGYVGVAYSVRGQGASEGYFDFFTSERIRGDLQAMIDFTKSLPDVNRDRVGVTGGSQGGIHAWMAAAYQMGVRAVVSVVANGRFEENFARNNAMNWLFSRTMQFTNVRLAQWVRDSILPALQRDDYYLLRSLLEGYSTKSLEENVSTPTFIIVSYHDEYFDPRAALEQFVGIPAPKRIVLYPAGHSLPTDPVQRATVNLMVDRWFAYWLKDDTIGNDVTDPETAVVMYDAATGAGRSFAIADSALYLRADAQPGPPPAHVRYHFTENGLSTTPSTSSGSSTIPYLSGLGSTNAVFRTAPFAADVVMTGAHGRVEFTANSPAANYQLNLLLFDIDTVTNSELPITRGHYQVRNNDPAARDRITFDLNPVYHILQAGHILEARVSGGIGILPKKPGEFGNVVVPTGISAVDTIFFGGAEDSFFTFYVPPSVLPSADHLSPPSRLSLEHYPNPARPMGSLTFNMTVRSGGTRLVLYDLLGREVAILVDTDLAEGRHDILLQGLNLPAGILYAVLSSGGESVTRKVLIWK